MPEKLSGHGKRRDATLTWTNEMRLLLLVLASDFKGSWAQRATVFNDVFHDHILSCGLQWTSHGSLSSQYSERTKTAENRAHAWAPVINPSNSERREARSRITEAAGRLGLQLQVQSFTQPTVPSLPPSTPPSTAKQKRNSSRPAFTHPDHRYEITPQSQRVIDATSSKESSLLTPPQSRSTKRARGSSQRRPITIEDDESDTEPQPKRARNIRRHPIVLIPRVPRSQLPNTPTKSQYQSVQKKKTLSSPRRLNATVVYRLPTGNEINLTQKEYEETLPDLVPPSEDAVHPPMSGLLFRYYDCNSQSPLTRRGFISGRHAKLNVPPAPPPTLDDPRFFWDDIFLHINREEIATPFLSCSNHLFWILRLALKESEKGVTDGRIAIINADALDQRSVFYTKPLLKELRKKRPFTKGAYMYHGGHEFLVYHCIKPSAILKTFSVKELVSYSRSVPSLGSVLRFESMTAPGGWKQRILPSLKASGVKWTSEVIMAVANLVKWLELNASTPDAIAHVISDVTSGWGIQVNGNNSWQDLARVFSISLCAANSGIVVRKNAEMAFLDGLFWGFGEFNSRHDPARITKLLRKAGSIGLGSPVDILMQELDAAKLRLVWYANKQKKLLRGTASGALLADADEDEDEIEIDHEDDDDGEETDIVSPTEEEHIVYEDE